MQVNLSCALCLLLVAPRLLQWQACCSKLFALPCIVFCFSGFLPRVFGFSQHAAALKQTLPLEVWPLPRRCCSDMSLLSAALKRMRTALHPGGERLPPVLAGQEGARPSSMAGSSAGPSGGAAPRGLGSAGRALEQDGSASEDFCAFTCWKSCRACVLHERLDMFAFPMFASVQWKSEYFLWLVFEFVVL